MNFERHFIANGDVTLCVERRGTGARHVLFAHGWISSRRMWYDVLDRLDPMRFTMHAMDFRGCGLSDRPETGHDLDGYASDLQTVLASIGAPVTLVAHSMGGRLAQYVATHAPANLARLILLAPGSAKSVRVSSRHRAGAEAAFGSRERIGAFVRAAMVREVDPQVHERLVEDALLAQREHWFGWYDRGRELDFSEHLTRIGVPSMVIAGAGDPLVPPSRAKSEVASALPASAFVMLRETGHNIPVERPIEVVEAVERFGQD